MMDRETHDDGAWFAAKRFGYGAGWPVAWQGWVTIIAFILAILGFSWLFPQVQGRAALLALGCLLIATIWFLRVIARRTRGGWRWRWGQRN